jgi:DNA-binding response OmpR family regulator
MNKEDSAMTAHLLLVDDDDLLRRSLAFNLEKAGYRISTAANAEDALLHSQRQRPDLVILDIGLPGMEACRSGIRERFSQSSFSRRAGASSIRC